MDGQWRTSGRLLDIPVDRGRAYGVKEDGDIVGGEVGGEKMGFSARDDGEA